jgi:hypothetical protein
MNVPFEYKLSEMINASVQEAIDGTKVIELEFRFARYRLVLDDPEKTQKLMELFLGKIVWPDKEEVQADTKLPRFYRNKRGRHED